MRRKSLSRTRFFALTMLAGSMAAITSARADVPAPAVTPTVAAPAVTPPAAGPAAAPAQPAGPTATTPSAAPATAGQAVSVPLTVAPSGKFCVDAMIDGKGPYSLLVDTGSEVMVIKPSVAAACGLTVKTGTVEVQGPTGGFVPVGQADVDTVTVAGLTLKRPVCTVETINLPYDGMIGAPLFNAGVVRLDLAGKKLTTYAADAFTPAREDVELPILFGSQRVPVVGGVIGGAAANLEIDTGSSFPAELNADFVDSHNLRDFFAKIGTVQHSSVSGVETSDVYDGRSLKLGDKEISKLDGAIPTLFLSSPVKRKFDGRVGCPLLTDTVMTFDYRHSKMYFTPQGQPKIDGSTISL